MFNSKLQQFYQAPKNTCKLKAFTQSIKIANHVLHTNRHKQTHTYILMHIRLASKKTFHTYPHSVPVRIIV